MRRRRKRLFALVVALGLVLCLRQSAVAADPLPPAIPTPSAARSAALTASPNPPGSYRTVGLPINLATAMQLAGIQPLDIAAAVAQVEQALALQLQAKALWVPNLNAGTDYFRHDGYQQNLFTGQLFQKDRQSLFTGGGPTLNVGLADAVYAPLAARRVVSSRRADLQAARNDSLLAVAQAYFALQDARGRILGAEATIVRAQRLVDLTRGLSPGLIAPLEINRARAELLSLQQTREVAIRDARTSSARLAEVILLDPGTFLEPIEPPFLQINLVRAAQTADELMPVAVNNRPEIASRSELLAAANMLLRQEKSRPLLPNLVMLSPATSNGMLAAGNMVGGPNQFLNQNQPRFDLEVAAVWQLQNGGVGNVGRIRQRRAEQQSASIELTRTLFRVRSEVAQALARVQTAQARVPQTAEELRQATESADKNFVGLRETTRPAGELLRLVVRPQEVVAALIALETAFEQYANAVNESNAAQFELYRALGQPAQWVTSQSGMPAGTVVPARAP